ncbi:MAG: hypothetical protein NZ533_10595 [Casimicrobiaceae bacterium]|nr:hypothetical protein [Casimicrobiaceae bacterium]MDW8311927.1 hypothetical protein [Burkholderiales bacterium]
MGTPNTPRHPAEYWQIAAAVLAAERRARLQAMTEEEALAELDRLTRGLATGEPRRPERAPRELEHLLALMRRAHAR